MMSPSQTRLRVQAVHNGPWLCHQY